MIRPVKLPGEGLEMYSPIGITPLDFLTTKEPVGRMKVFLDISEGGDKWRETDVKEVRTANGVIAYPGLGRMPVIVGKPETRYRVRVEAEFYFPHYKLTIPGGTPDGIEFDSFPYNDTNPPKNYSKPDFQTYINSLLKKLWLVPAPNYAFPNHVRVLRGNVVDRDTEEPVIGAEVRWGNKDKTLTGARGAFGLPLRVTTNDHLTKPQKIDVTDLRTPRQGTEDIIIPAALKTNLKIRISKP